MAISARQIPEKAPDTPWNIIDEEAVLLNLDTGHYYILNETGCRIWEMVDGRKTVEELAAQLCEEYEVELEVALRDTTRILEELLQEKLIRIVRA